jgi:hypothetical protein
MKEFVLHLLHFVVYAFKVILHHRTNGNDGNSADKENNTEKGPNND